MVYAPILAETAQESERTGPVTVVISRRVRPGCEAAYELWLEEVLEEINHFPGYLGTNILRPNGSNQPEFVAIMRFDSYANLSRWEQSNTRRNWLRRAEAIADDAHPPRRLDGLEFWFTPATLDTPEAPSRSRMAFLVIAILFCLGTWVNPVLRSLMRPLPAPVQLLALATFQVVLLMYCVMPWLTRNLTQWLFPKTKTR